MTNAAKLEGTPVATAKPAEGRALTKSDSLKQFITNERSRFETALPSHISFEKFQSTAMTAIISNADLLNADRASLMQSLIKCAGDGLLPDGRDAALVIFNSKDPNGNGWIKKVQYLHMYAGILKKCRQSGELASVVSHVVYEKDKFEYILGDDERIVHEPYNGKEDRGAIIAAYAIAKLKDGTCYREVMSLQDIEKVRRTSKSGNDDKGQPKGIWAAWYEEMSRKTVFRRLAKWLPQSIEKDKDGKTIFDRDFSMETEDTTPHDEAEATGRDASITIDNQTGEVLEGTSATQPDLKSEVERKKEADKPKSSEKPKSCKNCAGAGFRVDGDVKEPCVYCKGTGKA